VRLLYTEHILLGVTEEMCPVNEKMMLMSLLWCCLPLSLGDVVSAEFLHCTAAISPFPDAYVGEIV
jgi:hypothetical protein